MIKPPWALVIAIVLTSNSHLTRAAESQALVPGTREALDRVTSMNAAVSADPEQHCDEEPTTRQFLDEHLGSVKLSYYEYWSLMSCNELFSSKAPEWLENHPGIKNDPSLTKDWLPLCSLTHIQFTRSYLEQFSKVQNLVKASRRLAVSLDSCPSGKPPAKDDEDLGQAKLASLELAPKSEKTLDAKSRARVLERSKGIRQKVADLCCPREHIFQKDCLQAMNNVPITWCDPKKKGDCPSSGAVHQCSIAYIGDFLLSTESRILLDPSVDEYGQWINDDASMVHELGHACWYVRSKLNAKAGQEYEKDLIASKDCALTDTRKKLFYELMKTSGATTATIDCMIEVAKKSTQRRFDGGSCKGCPGKQLIEAHAMWLESTLSSTLAPDPGHPWKVCSAERDGDHPLFADLVACMMKSHKAREKFQKDTGCQGNIHAAF